MPTYFLGVTGSLAFDTNIIDAYWCVPTIAKKNDIILLYSPRSASSSRQGIFAEAVISESPSMENKDNFNCSGYRLLHAPITIQRRDHVKQHL